MLSERYLSVRAPSRAAGRAARLKRACGAQGRVRSAACTAFIVSLLLSLVAILGSDDLNRDGMLYVDAARAFVRDGWDAARLRFDWLFMPALIGGVSALTGLTPVHAAYALGAFFLAAACAVMVLVSERVARGSAWPACLVVLAMPGFNAYRDDVIREFGFWCLTLVAVWAALRWSECRTGGMALGSQLILVAAAAFRVEALAFLPVIVLWQLYAVRADITPGLAARVLVLPVIAAVAVSLSLAFDGLELSGRLEAYWVALDLIGKGARFSTHVHAFQEAVLPALSRGDAHYMLLIGLLSAIPVKFLRGLGVFVVPFACGLRTTVGNVGSRLLTGLVLVYSLLLAAFISEGLYLTGRYVTYLNLLVVPATAAGAMAMVGRWPRLKVWLVGVAVVAMLANVVSLSERKPQFKAAGAWLVENVSDADRVYVEGRRVRYHAGYPVIDGLPHEVVVQAPHRKAFDLFVVERDDDADPAALPAWLAQHQMELVTRFDGPGTDVLVLKPRQP